MRIRTETALGELFIVLEWLKAVEKWSALKKKVKLSLKCFRMNQSKKCQIKSYKRRVGNYFILLSEIEIVYKV